MYYRFSRIQVCAQKSRKEKKAFRPETCGLILSVSVLLYGMENAL